MALTDYLPWTRAPAASYSPVMDQVAAALTAQNAGIVHRADPQGGAFSQAFHRTMSDMRVSPDTSTQVAAIWACMDVIASSLSSSDWNVYMGVRGEDNKEAIPRDPLQYILNSRMNPEMTAQAGKRALGLAAAGWGNGYAEIEYDLAGRIKALWPIAPHRVDPRRDQETGELFFRCTQEYRGGFVDINADQMFVIRGASLTGFTGDNVLSRAIRTVATALAIDHYTEAYFGNNAQLGTVFMYKGGNMDDNNYNRAKESLNQKHSGAKRAYTTGMFTGEWDIKTFGNNMKDNLFSEVKSMTIEDICRWFHVPPHKIAHLSKATNNNIEHQGLEFSRDTMRPWVKEAEQEADYKLLPARGPSKFVELDVDWMEQGDYKSRMEAYSSGRAMGVFSANDILRKLGENTIGSDGDIRIVQGANVRLEDVGAAYGKEDQDPNVTGDQPTPQPKQDTTARAWLQTVYARIQRRVSAATAAGKPIVQARKEAYPFAREIVADLESALGDQYPAALHWAAEVVDGAELEIAVTSALKREQS